MSAVLGEAVRGVSSRSRTSPSEAGILAVFGGFVSCWVYSSLSGPGWLIAQSDDVLNANGHVERPLGPTTLADILSPPHGARPIAAALVWCLQLRSVRCWPTSPRGLVDGSTP